MRLERLKNTVKFGMRFGRTIIEHKISQARGEDCEFLTFFIYKNYLDLLGISFRDYRDLGVAGIISDATRYWFWADSFIDSCNLPWITPESLEGVFHKQQSESEVFGRVLTAIKESQLSKDIKKEVEELISSGKNLAFQNVCEFMKGFDPGKTSFEEVLEFRRKTSGELARLIIGIVGTSFSIEPEMIEEFSEMAVEEALGLQMGDDLIDWFSDMGKRPNLFNALLLVRKEELFSLQEAVRKKEVISSMRPYGIARKFAPYTLDVYLFRYRQIINLLPDSLKTLHKEAIAVMPHLSFTPQKGERIPLSLMSKRTLDREG